jgi:pectin methylesterase-like acyl-CoA thioesterase
MAVAFRAQTGGAATIQVDLYGSGEYTSIQTAINDAKNGDVIAVAPGIYYESIILNKDVTLMGL